jgi:hypothetical protein
VIAVAIMTFRVVVCRRPGSRVHHSAGIGDRDADGRLPLRDGPGQTAFHPGGPGQGRPRRVLIRSAEALKTVPSWTRSCWTRPAPSPRASPLSPTSGRPGAGGKASCWCWWRRSEHPLAAAILADARERSLTIPAVDGFGSVTSQGVQATLDVHQVLVDSACTSTDALNTAAAELSAHGKTPSPGCHRRRADQGRKVGIAGDGPGAGRRRRHVDLRVAGRRGHCHLPVPGDDANICQIPVFALAYNDIGIRSPPGSCSRFSGIRLSLMIIVAMALSSLSVVGNANRLRRYHLWSISGSHMSSNPRTPRASCRSV